MSNIIIQQKKVICSKAAKLAAMFLNNEISAEDYFEAIAEDYFEAIKKEDSSQPQEPK